MHALLRLATFYTTSIFQGDPPITMEWLVDKMQIRVLKRPLLEMPKGLY